MDHAQETVYVFKQSQNKKYKPKSKVKQEKEYNKAIATLNELWDTEISRHDTQCINKLEEFINKPTQKLKTVFLLKADTSNVIKKWRIENPSWQITSIHSKECPNFKTTLKLIVNRLTQNSSNSDKRLSYDFDLLKQFFQLEPLFVVIEDCEGFDIDVVLDLISYMQSYLNELNLTLVLNLHFPLPLTEQQLNRKHILQMDCLVLPELNIEQLVLNCFEKFNLSIGLKQMLLDSSTPEEVFRYLKYALLAYYSEGIANEVTETCLVNNINPNYRPLLEQSLMDASNYLNCSYNSVPASVLYQLSRESSIYINIYDFYMAFKEVVKRTECEDWDRQAMAFFLEGVAELKMVGVLRDCKRKFECVEKASWRGV